MVIIKKFDDKCIIVNIPIGIQQRNNFYEATRRCWRLNLTRARKANYILGTIDGVVKCVVKICSSDYVKIEFCVKQMEDCKRIFGVNTELCIKNRRIAFEGKEIKLDTKYLSKIIPSEYTPKQNPVRYTYE